MLTNDNSRENRPKTLAKYLMNCQHLGRGFVCSSSSSTIDNLSLDHTILQIMVKQILLNMYDMVKMFIIKK